MVTLEQVRLLETKVAKAIDFVNRVTDENTLLEGKLETYRKRIDELEGLVQRFKEEQGRIEEGILSALDRLNQFEDAIGRSLSTVQAAVEKTAPMPPVEAGPPAPEAEQSPVSVGLPAATESDRFDESTGFDESDSSGEANGFVEPDESDEAIMAALEAEEAAAKAGQQDLPPSGEDNNTAELDIF
ncbi:MAG: cell division protein ZapB [Treponema sp.]|jgi:hypothetical protein|nr:cell division protein ZapB [Treponema sp.]